MKYTNKMLIRTSDYNPYMDIRNRTDAQRDKLIDLEEIPNSTPGITYERYIKFATSNGKKNLDEFVKKGLVEVFTVSKRGVTYHGYK